MCSIAILNGELFFFFFAGAAASDEDDVMQLFATISIEVVVVVEKLFLR